MGRLFVDCDDTLVLWLNADGQALEGQNPYGGGSDRYELNRALIDAIEYINDWDIVVWSGGGAQYAQVWAERVGWAHAECYSKDIRLPTAHDLCVDDASLVVACPLLTWQEFVAEAQKAGAPR